MTQLADRDYFTDYEILQEPYEFFEAVREKGPLYQPEGKDYLIVTGFNDIVEIMLNSADYSAVIGLQGAAAPLPFQPDGSDITAQIEANRPQFHGGDLVVNLDDQPHMDLRMLVNRLFTPSRLKANERFFSEYADRMVRDVVSNGKVEVVSRIATPFVTIVIADLLGVPAEDRQAFMDAIERSPCPGNLEGDLPLDAPDHPFVLMGSYFAGYVQDRLAHPRDDVLSELTHAKYRDGSSPDPMDIVKLGMFMFGAGQDTSAKLLSNAMRYIVDVPGLQDRLRADPSLIPAMLEEVLRLEGSTKQSSRLARRDTVVAGTPVPAGTKLLLGLAAGNRDPGRWENPEEFVLNRPKIKEHIAFGRGAHTCAGAPLARAEVRIILEKFFEHTSHIDIDEAQHGPPGNRRLNYEPSFIIRGLSELHLKLTPSPDFKPLDDAERKSLKPEDDSAVSRAGYSTTISKIGDLLADPEAKSILDKHLPGMADDKRVAMASGMTLRAVQAFAPNLFTNEILDRIDADLAGLSSA